MRGFLRQYWITMLLLVAITVLCFMDTTPLPEAPMTDFDKLIHFLMFAVVSGTIFFENSHYFKHPVSSRRIVLGSFLFPIIFSGLIEIGQEYLTPYRSGDWMDFLYDCIGAAVGYVVCLVINRRITSKTEHH